MSIVGIFTKSQPTVGGFTFDAILDESSEMITDISQYPLEIGAIGNDHTMQRPLRITLTVGVSDNLFRGIANSAGNLSSLASAGASLVTGKVVSLLGDKASLLGLGASLANAAYAAGSAATRSQSMLEAVRDLQRTAAVIDVVGAKGSYKNCIISNTRTDVNKENEQGLELVIELQQLLIVNSSVEKLEVPAPDDTAETQAQNMFNLGQVTLQ